ncbi:hypothetical protein [Actinomadura gamaensis]|uniref:Uncharacterized protein n=1 Tax=Actinomadura gamaensis TaxID=1763541 RepID=A0ABV9TVD6_9ACTN
MTTLTRLGDLTGDYVPRTPGARGSAEARKTIDRHEWGANQNALSRLFVRSAVDLEIEVTAVRLA